MIDMVGNRDKVDNMNIVDSIDMMNMQMTFGYLLLLEYTSVQTRLTW